MATKYRTEKEVITITINLNIPDWLIPEGVDPQQASELKISGLPVALRSLGGDLFTDKTSITKIQAALDSTRIKPIKTIKTIAPRPPELALHDTILAGVEEYCYREEREREGKYYRGKKAKMPDIYHDISNNSKWLHALFRYYKKRDTPPRPDEVQEIYDARERKHKKITIDPNLMTYFCYQVLYEDQFAANRIAFPKLESFRKKYLQKAAHFRHLKDKTPEQVSQLIDDPASPLNIIHLICRKLQI